MTTLSRGMTSTGPSALVFFALFLPFSTTTVFFMQRESWRAIANLQNKTGLSCLSTLVFFLWNTRSHALWHIDRRQESMLWLTSMASGLVHWVWGFTTKSSELSSPDLPYLSSSHLASQAGNTKTLQIGTKQPTSHWLGHSFNWNPKTEVFKLIEQKSMEQKNVQNKNML